MKLLNSAVLVALSILVFMLVMLYVVANNQALNTGLFAALMLAGFTGMLLKVGCSE